MWGCAGTRTFTVRSRDEHRWMSLQKVNCHRLGSRLAFQLREESYFLPSVFREAATDGATHDGAAHNQVLIRSIVFVRLGEQAPPIVETLSSLSALHQLYPAFLDTVRGDVLVGGDSCLLDGAVPLQVRRHLQLQLACALENVAVLEYETYANTCLDDFDFARRVATATFPQSTHEKFASHSHMIIFQVHWQPSASGFGRIAKTNPA